MTDIQDDQTIWFPGRYKSRGGAYDQVVGDLTTDQVVTLVQKRAQEDGDWIIENDKAGGKVELMHRMMEWVSRPTNIRQCLEGVLNENKQQERTVDDVCRELAEASKMIGGGHMRGPM